MLYNISRDVTKMVNFYAGTNMTPPIGIGTNDTNSLRAINMYRTLRTSPNPSSFHAEKTHASNFAQAIYGDGPYSLMCPNNTTETKAVNLDYIA